MGQQQRMYGGLPAAQYSDVSLVAFSGPQAALAQEVSECVQLCSSAQQGFHVHNAMAQAEARFGNQACCRKLLLSIATLAWVRSAGMKPLAQEVSECVQLCSSAQLVQRGNVPMHAAMHDVPAAQYSDVSLVAFSGLQAALAQEVSECSAVFLSAA